MTSVRVALCQIECHPAIYTDHIAWYEEPFVPDSPANSLSQLGRKHIDVEPAFRACTERYREWSASRLRSILATLRTLEPPPDLVVFPEGAVSIDQLPLLHEWAQSTKGVVLAGSHTPSRNASAQQAYKRIGLQRPELRKIEKYGAKNVLPVIAPTGTQLIPKTLSSPFEQSLVNNRAVLPAIRSLALQLHDRVLEVLPLICSDALQPVLPATQQELTVVVSHETRPDRFKPFIGTSVSNQIPVAYCNDGKYGGTNLHCIRDTRKADWFHDSLPDGLPPGDSLLVVDLDLGATAVEVGVSNPGQALKLVLLCDVVAEWSRAHEVTRQVAAARKLTDATERADSLRRAQKTQGASRLQQARLEHLAFLEGRGLECSDWWDAIGIDCTVEGQDSLAKLEAQLAANCSALLTGILTKKGGAQKDVAAALFPFIARCNDVAKGTGPDAASPAREGVHAIFDRDSEVSHIHAFLDDPHLTVLEVSGLQQIGKSSAVTKAMTQSGLGAVATVSLTSTASPEFLVASILAGRASTQTVVASDLVAMIRGETVLSALRSLRVLLIEGTHNLLLERDVWRDELTPTVLSELSAVAKRANAKLILETRRDLPIALDDPSIRTRLRIYGLDRERLDQGVALFDAQLRRAGLSPTAVSRQDKVTIVSRFGGHPVAVALAADACYEQGTDELLAALKNRRGSYLNFISRLVGGLALADEEQMLLRILCLARMPVPRAVVLGAAPFPASPYLRNLVATGAVDIDEGGHVQISTILRETFEPTDLPPTSRDSFHNAAARVFAETAKGGGSAGVSAAVEAEFHAGLARIDVGVSTSLIDGSFAVADRLFADERFDEAAGLLRTLLKRKHPYDVLRMAALCEARRGRFDEALPLARRAFERNPKDVPLLADLARFALTQFQDDAVEELVAIARVAQVHDVGVLVVEGRLALRRGQFAKAEEVLLEAIQLTERNAWPYYFLGHLYVRANRLDDALETLHQGENFYYERELRSRNALRAIRTELAKAYLFADRLDLAEQIVQSLLQEEPDSPEVARVYAALTIKKEGITEAHKVLSKLQEAKTRTRHDKSQFHLFYGMFYLGIDDHVRASEEFEKAHNADRSNVYVMLKWARTLSRIATDRRANGDDSFRVYVRDCARLIQRIREYDPPNPEAREIEESLQRRFGASDG